MLKKIASLFVMGLMITGIFAIPAFAAKGQSGPPEGKGPAFMQAAASSGSGGGMPGDRGRKSTEKGETGTDKGSKVSVDIPVTVEGLDPYKDATVYLVREFSGIVDAQIIVAESQDVGITEEQSEESKTVSLTGTGFGDYQVVVVQKDDSEEEFFAGLYNLDTGSVLTTLWNNNDKLKDSVGFNTVTPYADATNDVNVTANEGDWMSIYMAILQSTDSDYEATDFTFRSLVDNLWTNYNGLVEGE